MARTSRGRDGESHRRPVRPGKNAPASEKLQVSVFRTIFSKTFVVATITTMSVILIITGSIMWYTKLYADPEHVFWATIDNNLSTRGVTKELSEQNQGNASVKLTQLSWNPDLIVKTIRQLAYSNTNPPTKLTLEGISTPTETFQRYMKIDQGIGKDYSNIYRMWLKGDPTNASGSSVSFNDAVFNVALFGNLNKDDRDEVVEKLKKVYKVSLGNIEKQSIDGRRTYSYDVTMNLREYAEAARLYAQKLGLPSANMINPANYKPGDELGLRFTIDVLSRQLVEVFYKQTQTTEKYSGYGIAPDTEAPKKHRHPRGISKSYKRCLPITLSPLLYLCL